MNTFAVIGTVPKFSGREFSLLVENGDDLQRWWREKDIATILKTVAGKPSIKVRREFAAECVPGRKIRHTIEIHDRRDGRRIRGISIVQL